MLNQAAKTKYLKAKCLIFHNLYIRSYTKLKILKLDSCSSPKFYFQSVSKESLVDGATVST